MGLDLLPYLEDHACLVAHDASVFKVKLNYIDEPSPKHKAFFLQSLSRQAAHDQLEDVLRAVLYILERDQQILPVQTKDFVIYPETVPWPLANKIEFLIDGKVLHSYPNCLVFKVQCKQMPVVQQATSSVSYSLRQRSQDGWSSSKERHLQNLEESEDSEANTINGEHKNNKMKSVPVPCTSLLGESSSARNSGLLRRRLDIFNVPHKQQAEDCLTIENNATTNETDLFQKQNAILRSRMTLREKLGAGHAASTSKSGSSVVSRKRLSCTSHSKSLIEREKLLSSVKPCSVVIKKMRTNSDSDTEHPDSHKVCRERSKELWLDMNEKQNNGAKHTQTEKADEQSAVQIVKDTSRRVKEVENPSVSNPMSLEIRENKDIEHDTQAVTQAAMDCIKKYRHQRTKSLLGGNQIVEKGNINSNAHCQTSAERQEDGGPERCNLNYLEMQDSDMVEIYESGSIISPSTGTAGSTRKKRRHIEDNSEENCEEEDRIHERGKHGQKKNFHGQVKSEKLCSPKRKLHRTHSDFFFTKEEDDQENNGKHRLVKQMESPVINDKLRYGRQEIGLEDNSNPNRLSADTNSFDSRGPETRRSPRGSGTFSGKALAPTYKKLLDKNLLSLNKLNHSASKQEKSGRTVYPNPSETDIQIQYSGDITFRPRVKRKGGGSESDSPDLRKEITKGSIADLADSDSQSSDLIETRASKQYSTYKNEVRIKMSKKRVTHAKKHAVQNNVTSNRREKLSGGIRSPSLDTESSDMDINGEEGRPKRPKTSAKKDPRRRLKTRPVEMRRGISSSSASTATTVSRLSINQRTRRMRGHRQLRTKSAPSSPEGDRVRRVNVPTTTSQKQKLRLARRRLLAAKDGVWLPGSTQMSQSSNTAPKPQVLAMREDAFRSSMACLDKDLSSPTIQSQRTHESASSPCLMEPGLSSPVDGEAGGSEGKDKVQESGQQPSRFWRVLSYFFGTNAKQ